MVRHVVEMVQIWLVLINKAFDYSLFGIKSVYLQNN